MTCGNVLFIFAAVTGSAALFLIGLDHPHLTIEGGIVETAGATAFAIASMISFSLLLLPATPKTFAHRLSFAGLGAFALLLFLSEIGFGSRIFDFQMPRMRGGGEFDGAHDVVVILYRSLEDAGRIGWLLASLGFGAILALGATAVYVSWDRLSARLRRVLASTFDFRLAVALVMLAGAVVLDLLEFHEAEILEEVLEFSASVALMAAASALFWRSVRGVGPWPLRSRPVPSSTVQR